MFSTRWFAPCLNSVAVLNPEKWSYVTVVRLLLNDPDSFFRKTSVPRCHWPTWVFLSLISCLFLNTRAVCRIPTWVLVSLNVQSSHITCLTFWMLAGHKLLSFLTCVFSSAVCRHLDVLCFNSFISFSASWPLLWPMRGVRVCVFSLYQGKEVCLWYLISSAPQTPADPPPFIPCPTCKLLDLWLAVLMRVYMYPVRVSSRL